MAPLTQSFSFASQSEFNISPSQYAQNSNSDVSEGIRCVTISQLLKATESGNANAPFQIDGFPVKRVMLVANVYSEDAETFGGKVSYGLDDGTGRIKGSYWADPKAKKRPFDNFAYARVSGELEMYKSSKSMKILFIVPVSSYYEVCHHTMHVIFDSLALEKGHPPQNVLQQLTPATSVNGVVTQRQILHRKISISDSEDEVDTSSRDLRRKIYISDSEDEIDTMDQNLRQTKSISDSEDSVSAPESDGSPVDSSFRFSPPAPPPSDRNRSELTQLEQAIIVAIKNRTIETRKGANVRDFVPDLIALYGKLDLELTSNELWLALDSLTIRELIGTTIGDEWYRCM